MRRHYIICLLKPMSLKADCKIAAPLHVRYKQEEGYMEKNQRHSRLRKLISKLNKERKKQAQKIDILCNDLIAAQKDFIRSLDRISFAAHFYEAIIGRKSLSDLFDTAGDMIRQKIREASVAFVLRGENGFEIHTPSNDHGSIIKKQQLRSYFSEPVLEAVSYSNKPCSLNEIFAMGMGGSPKFWKGIQAGTVPLGRFGQSDGFIFICRRSQRDFTPEEISNMTAISRGLSQAVRACRANLQPSD